VWDGLQPARIPMVDPARGEEVNWAIEHVPSLDVDRLRNHRTASPARELVTA
jgi:hypothetical protein